MIIVNVKMIEFAKKELTPIIMQLGNITEETIYSTSDFRRYCKCD